MDLTRLSLRLLVPLGRPAKETERQPLKDSQQCPSVSLLAIDALATRLGRSLSERKAKRVSVMGWFAHERTWSTLTLTKREL